MEALFQLFDMIEHLEEGLREYIQSKLVRGEYKKKHVFLREGQIARHIFFLEKGLVRCYREVEQGDISMWFMCDNDIFLSVGSFFSQTISFDNIVALEDCIAYSISYEEVDFAYRRFRQFNYHRGVILEKYYNLSEIRGHWRQLPAHIAFECFMQQQSDLLGRVPDKYLATYLGMTPSTFSFIKTQYFGRERNKHL